MLQPHVIKIRIKVYGAQKNIVYLNKVGLRGRQYYAEK